MHSSVSKFHTIGFKVETPLESISSVNYKFIRSEWETENISSHDS